MLLSKKIWFVGAGILALSAGILYTSCTHEYIENINPVCFESDVLPIFQSNCTQSGCHNANDREKGYDLSNYDGIVSKGIVKGSYRKSELYKVCVPPFNSMPQSPYSALTDAQLTTIALWIEQGAENTTNCSNTGVCDTTNVTLSGSVQPILQKYCTGGCHSGSSPSAGIDYTNYISTKSTATDGSLVGSVLQDGSFSSMPKGGNKISDCEIAKIQKWVALGAKND